jgi:hypothetical protein
MGADLMPSSNHKTIKHRHRRTYIKTKICPQTTIIQQKPNPQAYSIQYQIKFLDSIKYFQTS